MIFNHYLSKNDWNQDKRYVFKSTDHTDLTEGQITKDLIENICMNAAHKDAVILTHLINGSHNQGHAVALKKVINPADNTHNWYLLDSQNNNPKKLRTPRDWSTLKGSIISIEHGSIWECLAPSSDFHLSDRSMPFDEANFN